MFRTRAYSAVAIVILAVGGLAACAAPAASTPTTAETVVTQAASSELWDSSVVHSISVDFSDADYQAAIAAYLADGSKEWITATVTIDGTTIENVGIKLKGNSTLRAVSADSAPEDLPWIIRLDKYVDGQSYDGETELVVRGNSSETALNEAVALELLGAAGLATEKAISSAFTVNGSSAALRLVIQNPNDTWDDEQFGDDGLLYKAEAGGDYSYRGDDPESYTDIFDQEVGDDNLVPLTDFLKFINESDDATFAADLSTYLDIDSFATYLAYQDLVDNFDDIDGPGNNSYLRYDETTGQMTVVNWDLNLAFGTQNVGGGGQGGGGPQGGGGQPPAGGGNFGGGGNAGPGGLSGNNILTSRFLENADFAALVDAAKTDLTATLFTSGTAQQILDEWTATLATQTIVDQATVTSEAEAIRAYFN